MDIRNNCLSIRGSWRVPAFSLPEILLTVAVIGAIVAVAVPIFGRMAKESAERAALRNAQSLAATAGQAVHAGNTSVSAAATKEEAIELLSEGVYGDGDFAGTLFHVGLDADEQEEAAEFVEFEDGIMTYKRKP